MKIPVPTAKDTKRCRKNPNKPPTFRGADFTMRWEQGRWSEERIIEGINATKAFRAIPYGKSQLGPVDRARMQEYWKAYATAESHGKRPDILVLHAKDFAWANKILGPDPTTVSDADFAPVVARAICGIEAENSLWQARKMPDFASTVPLPRLDMKSPNIWVKDQDLPCLLCWMHHHQKPIIIVQVFYEAAYGVLLLEILRRVQKIVPTRGENRRALQKTLGVVFRKQKYMDARIGQAQEKLVYVTHHSVGIPFGELEGKVRTHSQVILEANGKILPYVVFKGGRLRITAAAKDMIRKLAS